MSHIGLTELSMGIVSLQEQIKLLNAALDLQISRSTGKNIKDPRIQEHKEILLNKIREGMEDDK
jgi:hypothetical protein